MKKNKKGYWCCVCKEEIPRDRDGRVPILISIFLQSAVIRDRGARGTVCCRKCALKFVDKMWEEL